MKNLPLFVIGALIYLSVPAAVAGVISFSGPLTDDASTEIDPANTYTHTISGGGEESVNGVTFELLDGSTTPANLTWEVSSVKNQINDNNGGWDPVTGGVTGPGLLGLLGSFTYNNESRVRESAVTIPIPTLSAAVRRRLSTGCCSSC